MLNAVIHLDIGIEHLKEDLVVYLFGSVLTEVVLNLLYEVILDGDFSSLRVLRVNGDLLLGLFPYVIKP